MGAKSGGMSFTSRHSILFLPGQKLDRHGPFGTLISLSNLFSVQPRIQPFHIMHPFRFVTLFALAASGAFAQTVIIDNFGAGDFSVSSSAGFSATQAGPAGDIVGGSRDITVVAGTPYTVEVAGGFFSATSANRPGIEIQFDWGSSTSLGLDLASIPNGGFWVDVTQSLVSFANFKFSVFTDGTHSSESSFVSLAQEGLHFVPFSSFAATGSSGAADFSKINQIRFVGGLVPEQGLGALWTLNTIYASAVPEPESWAMFSAIGLLGFAACRGVASSARRP